MSKSENILLFMSLYQNLLVRDPFPEPNKSRPVSITGNIADVPFNMDPAANVHDPNTHRKENRNTPTVE